MNLENFGISSAESLDEFIELCIDTALEFQALGTLSTDKDNLRKQWWNLRKQQNTFYIIYTRKSATCSTVMTAQSIRAAEAELFCSIADFDRIINFYQLSSSKANEAGS